MHEWDGETPVEETLSTLDSLVKAGKIRYLAASNYSGWQLMKALAVPMPRLRAVRGRADLRLLEARDAEYELVPLALDQGLGILVPEPARGRPAVGQVPPGRGPAGGVAPPERWSEPPVRNEDRLYDTIEVLVDVAKAHEVSAAQVALAWRSASPA